MLAPVRVAAGPGRVELRRLEAEAVRGVGCPPRPPSRPARLVADEEKRWWKKYTTSDWVPSGARKEVYRGVKWWLYYRALAAWISKPEGLRPEGHRPEGHRPKAPDFVLKFLGLAVRVLV